SVCRLCLCRALRRAEAVASPEISEARARGAGARGSRRVPPDSADRARHDRSMDRGVRRCAMTPGMDVRNVSVTEGYTQWAKDYDSYANPLIAVEEAAVRELMGDVREKSVLDAACGT